MRSTVQAVLAAALAGVIAVISAAPSDAALRKVALGVSYYNPGDQSNGGYADLSRADAYRNSSIGRYPAIWAVWSDWGGSNSAFPTTLMSGIKQRGMVPLVNWQPLNPAKPDDCVNWELENIIDGDHDAYIRQWAQAAKSHGGRILLRFAHEMNGYWFIWGYQQCTNTPFKFTRAWQHVWNIFRNEVGATNVKFVWSPYGAYKLPAHYPGNAYVDYVGVTAFNWGPDQYGHRWVSMVGAFKPTMSALANMGNTKPVIAAEMGAAYLPACATCNKPAWIRNGYPAVYTKWPKIKAFVYFDIDMRIQRQPDWRLASPAGALAEYVTIAQQAKFQGAIP